MSDKFDKLAEGLLPCRTGAIDGCGVDVDTGEIMHGIRCQARSQSTVAAALRAANQAGYARGVEDAAKHVEEPYPERWFPELSEAELSLASTTLQGIQAGLIDRLHAGWARHWATLIRALIKPEEGKG